MPEQQSAVGMLDLRENVQRVPGRYVQAGRWDGVDYRFVPDCCLSCRWYDAGEPGEYGSTLTGPSCGRGIWMPTQTGTCKRESKRE